MSAPMLEKDYQRRITDLAKIFGWRYAHFRPAQTAQGWRTAMSGDAGFFDLVLVRPPRVIFAEIKVGSPVRPEQQNWIDDVSRCSGVECYLWRPADWDEVVRLLSQKVSVP